MNFTKFLRTPFLTEHLRWLLLFAVPSEVPAIILCEFKEISLFSFFFAFFVSFVLFLFCFFCNLFSDCEVLSAFFHHLLPMITSVSNTYQVAVFIMIVISMYQNSGSKLLCNMAVLEKLSKLTKKTPTIETFLVKLQA